MRSSSCSRLMLVRIVLKFVQHATEPALGDEVHAGSLGVLDDDRLRLLLGANEQDVAAAALDLLDRLLRLLDAA